MASSTSASERRSQVVVGDLAPDFLRLPHSGAYPESQQVALDHQTAQMLQAQQSGGGGFTFVGANMARLSLTIVQAKLTKNYGFTKMDPYCRIRVGHAVLETQTAHNGAKNPQWNKTVQCFLPAGVDSIYIEVFDERAFTMDDRVAWAHISIPPRVMEGETVDDWYPLSGKQGEEKEGVIQVVFTFIPAQQQQMPVVMVPTAQPVYYPMQQTGGNQVVQQPYPPQQQRPPPGPMFTDEDVKQVKELFPDMEDEVIKSVLESNLGNKDRTINDLLQMNS